MLTIADGLIEIDINEFFEILFKEKYIPRSLDFVAFGVPRTNIHNETLEIPFASSTSGSPGQWTNPPEFLNEWKQKRNYPNEMFEVPDGTLTADAGTAAELWATEAQWLRERTNHLQNECVKMAEELKRKQ